MPAVSQQQQKIFGLALSVKRGETPRSEASQEVLDIVDSMTEKDIEDFAGTEHKGLPKKVEQKLREKIREIIKNNINEVSEPQIITQLKDVLKTGYKSIKDPKTGKKMKVDRYSASAIVGVYDKLNQSNKEKFAQQGLLKMQSIAFKLLKNESVVSEGIWPKSKLSPRFEFLLAPELKKKFKGTFHVDGYDLYHNNKMIMRIDRDKDSVNSIVNHISRNRSIQKNESVNEASDDYDYAGELQDAVEKTLKGKNIKGWRLDVDSRSGTFEYTKKGIDLVVYATPMWDGNKFVPFNVQDMEGDDVDMIQRVIGNRLTFKPTYDVKKDVSNYISVVTKTLAKVEQVYSKLNIKGNTPGDVGMRASMKDNVERLKNESVVNELKKLPNGNFSIKKGYNTFADYEKNAKPGDTILKYGKRGNMIKTFVNGSELNQNAKKYLSKVHSIVGDKVNLSLFGKQGISTIPDYEKKEVGVLVLESIVSERKPSKIVWDTKKISDAKRINVRKWYMKTYPTDELGGEIDKRISLWDVYEYLSQGRDAYKIIGVGDSVVRERIFEKLSKVLGVDYDTIYNMWESVINELSYADGPAVGWIKKKNGKKEVVKVFNTYRGALMWQAKTGLKLLHRGEVQTVGVANQEQWEKHKAQFPNQYVESVVNEAEKPKVVTKAEWDRTHKDFKGMVDGKPYMMWLDKKTQETIYGPVTIKEGVVSEGKYDDILDKIQNTIQNASSFMNVGKELKNAGIKYDFSTSMIPMYRIKVPGNTIAIVNKRYAADAEREVKDMAIGLLEGKFLQEGRAFINAAKKAKEEGKTEFEFNGKTYPVTLKENMINEMNDAEFVADQLVNPVADGSMSRSEFINFVSKETKFDRNSLGKVYDAYFKLGGRDRVKLDITKNALLFLSKFGIK
jgi:hypothetical protein